MTFTLRADAARPVTIAFEEKSALYPESRPTMVSRSTVRLDQEWQDVTLLLPARDRVGDIVWVPSLRVGESPIAVECQGVKVELVDRDAYWKLDASDGAEACFAIPDLSTSAGRLDILDPGDQPAQLQLSQPIALEDLRKPTRYTLMLRADWPREVWIGMGEGAEPWRPIVAPQRVTLGVDWTTHVLFADPASMSGEKFQSIRLFLWLGGSATSIEWRGVVSHEMGVNEWPISLASTPAAQVQFDASEDPSRVGVVPVQPGSAPFDAQVQVALPAIEEGKIYRLTATLGSAKSRLVVVAVNQSREPWGSLGLSRSVPLGSPAEDLLWDFQATASDEKPRLVIAVGGDGTPIEVGSISLHEVDRKHSPIIRTGEELCRRTSVTDDPNGVRFLLEATDDPWGIKLASGSITLHAGNRYALSALLRAQGERTILLGAGESNPPWSMSFPPTKLSIGPSWRHFLFHFVADRDVPNTEAILCLGGSELAVDVGSLLIEPASSPPIWRLESADDHACRVVPPADWTGESFEVSQVFGDPWRVKLTTNPIGVEKGASYRVRGRFRRCPLERSPSVSLRITSHGMGWDSSSKSK